MALDVSRSRSPPASSTAPSRSTRRDKIYVLDRAVPRRASPCIEVLTYAAPDFPLWSGRQPARRRC